MSITWYLSNFLSYVFFTCSLYLLYSYWPNYWYYPNSMNINFINFLYLSFILSSLWTTVIPTHKSFKTNLYKSLLWYLSSVRPICMSFRIDPVRIIKTTFAGREILLFFCFVSFWCCLSFLPNFIGFLLFRCDFDSRLRSYFRSW